MIYKFTATKAKIYVNTKKKSLSAIKTETGCDVVINGGIYNMSTFSPLCHLKVDGKVLASDQYKYWGFAWNNDSNLVMTNTYSKYLNYICCSALCKDGKKVMLSYNSDMGGKRGRTALGVLPSGEIVIYCSKDGTKDALTPEQLQQFAIDNGWKHGVMLDSGGSSQCITPVGNITSTRKVQNVICFWLKKETTKTNTTEGEVEKPMTNYKTESEVRNAVVNTAKAYLGYKESNGTHKKIIDLYNSHKPLARGYKVKYNDAWCATFVSAVAVKCGLTDIIPTECSCTKMIELHKKLGQWKESDSYVPMIGDIIMYDWEDSGSGDNTGAPNHVGIVTKLSGNTITVIEGNKNNAVEYRTMKVNGKFIRGYCLPNYKSKVTVSNKVTTHKVRSGDTLWSISKQYLGNGARWDEISKYNNLKSTVIRPGQVLKIPTK